MVNGENLTCNGSSMATALAPSNENNIALARVGVVVLKEKHLIDSIVCQCLKLDYDPKRSRQSLFKNEILLAAHLRRL